MRKGNSIKGTAIQRKGAKTFGSLVKFKSKGSKSKVNGKG